ncbi:MAG: type II toxin-antitoxin system RatA family toxin, partial [Sphingomonadales bacterium]|nr:type II toxin-antitoxin system RatA family toxin [Sphingomonadales bacterium]
PEQMFDLVADVARYDEFLPWVIAVRVRSDSETDMVADLVVGFKSLRETFTSRVKKRRPEAIEVDYVEGPLKYLHNDWKFLADREGGCIIEFCVDFAFRNKLFELLAGQVFDKALRRMTNAFEARADALYGPSGSVSTRASGISSSSAHNAA